MFTFLDRASIGWHVVCLFEISNMGINHCLSWYLLPICNSEIRHCIELLCFFIIPFLTMLLPTTYFLYNITTVYALSCPVNLPGAALSFTHTWKHPSERLFPHRQWCGRPPAHWSAWALSAMSAQIAANTGADWSHQERIWPRTNGHRQGALRSWRFYEETPHHCFSLKTMGETNHCPRWNSTCARVCVCGQGSRAMFRRWGEPQESVRDSHDESATSTSPPH